MKNARCFIKEVCMLVLWILCYYQYVAGQPPDWQSKMFEQNANFYTIQEEVNAYFDSLPPTKSIKNNHYKDFVRWEWFWQDRVDNVNSNK